MISDNLFFWRKFNCGRCNFFPFYGQLLSLGKSPFLFWSSYKPKSVSTQSSCVWLSSLHWHVTTQQKTALPRVVDWVEVTSWGSTNCWPREYGDNMSVYHIKRIVFLGEKFTLPSQCHSRNNYMFLKVFCGFSKILVIFLCLCNLKTSKQTTLAAIIFMPGLDFRRLPRVRWPALCPVLANYWKANVG